MCWEWKGKERERICKLGMVGFLLSFVHRLQVAGLRMPWRLIGYLALARGFKPASIPCGWVDLRTRLDFWGSSLRYSYDLFRGCSDGRNRYRIRFSGSSREVFGSQLFLQLVIGREWVINNASRGNFGRFYCSPIVHAPKKIMDPYYCLA